MASNRGLQIGSAWFQRKLNLRPQHRGVHLVTEEILKQVPELSLFAIGLCHIQSEYQSTLEHRWLLLCCTPSHLSNCPTFNLALFSNYDTNCKSRDNVDMNDRLAICYYGSAWSVKTSFRVANRLTGGHVVFSYAHFG